MFALLDVSPISTEMDAAHLRFALKSLPHVLAQTVSGDDGPAPDSLTHSMREALPDTHPWKARTAHLAAELQLDLASPHTDHAALRDALTSTRSSSIALTIPTQFCGTWNARVARSHAPSTAGRLCNDAAILGRCRAHAQHQARPARLHVRYSFAFRPALQRTFA